MYVQEDIPTRAVYLTSNQTGTANLQASSLIQAITLALVEEWGYNNFFAHTQAVADFYREKRDVFESALNAHLSGLAEWSTPEAGMFFWFVHLFDVDRDVLPMTSQ
jgi:DNA-binding transcriptional MocR family regulator